MYLNHTSSFYCGVNTYLQLCASSKVILLVPGFGLNIFILASLISCLLSRRRKIRNNVAVFILGSTTCNLVNLSLWPLIIHWRTHGRWALGEGLCEVMVSAKQLTSSASYHYVSFISFSIYLTVVCDCGRLVNSRAFLALELLFPLLPVGLKELTQWVLGTRVEHLDPVNHTCFSYINDRVIRVLMLVKIAVFLPLNLYFYAHVLHTIFRSATVMHRSQTVNKKLAKVFSVICLITLLAHLPGGIFTLMEEHTVCQEMVKEFLLDLPLLSSPIILLCMNKELQTHCVTLLKCKPECYGRKDETWRKTEEQQKSLTVGETVVTSESCL
ncbi:visual pigment-like receptor peropsin [Coregonus clupeaformis]|uniref:visual pigment-like receptor peropsin n=1 Tax=Coregonus clupeaformis TaxID=59861 RepID=UPI001BE09167|nr:visual pigment-like receptor peropsin [Coregonus clupeaformis]